MVVDDEEKANILNTFFSTVFTVENEMLGEIPRNNENPILRVTNLTQEEVRNRLNKIKIDKSPGPDGIHPRVLRELTTGSVPQDWRIANVVPIFKKGSKSESGNYRPVSLTSIVGKIFEGFLRDVILDYLNENNCLTPYQHGFMRNRSCQTNLISFFMKRLSNGLDGVRIDNKDQISILTFFNVSEKDYGNYTCVASNKLGNSNASVILYEYGLYLVLQCELSRPVLEHRRTGVTRPPAPWPPPASGALSSILSVHFDGVDSMEVGAVERRPEAPNTIVIFIHPRERL
ncbi:unnamed protein product [Ranitomeya imitator]|uniref:Immunoglobulin I-set domain-containing protein n=1 Tax=Ranitomeya imitator TaxID=111125 RepID=A0ABN9M396_9NEOB|nr:unnamed protein product [Ranitomeya imitator]